MRLKCLFPLWSQVRALWLLIWWPLEAYMVVNFRARGISRGARKLTRTPTLNLKKKKNRNWVYDTDFLFLVSCLDHFIFYSFVWFLATINANHCNVMLVSEGVGFVIKLPKTSVKISNSDCTIYLPIIHSLARGFYFYL